MSWVCLFLVTSFQADFKLFYQEGKQLYQQQNYEVALEKFKEAYRLNPKPQRYKVEGTFFDDYQPRYWIALCYQHLDIAEAEHWMSQSKEALEGEISKKRELVAEYNRADRDISDRAQNWRTKRNAEYNLELQKARDFANQDQFDQAEQIYRELARRFPLRAEAKAGLETLPSLKARYLDQKFTSFRLAVNEKRFQEAEQILAQMRKVEAQFEAIPQAESLLAEARTKATTSPAELQPKPEPKHPVVVKTDPPPERVVTPPPEQNLQADQDALKAALMDALKPYRRGDPETALHEVEGLSLEGQETSPSYMWLRGLFNLESFRQSDHPKQEWLTEAEKWMGLVHRHMPEFEPDPKLYPDYVLTFFMRIKAGQ